MRITNLLLFIILLLYGACAYQFPEEELYTETDLGKINPGNVIAVGDDFLAGVMDGALYHSGQLISIPSLIAGQLNIVSPVRFNQPTVESETGLNLFKSTADTVYGKWIYRFEDITAALPERLLTGGEVPGKFSGDKSLLGNFAIPGLVIDKLNSSSLNENPYYNRIATSPGTSTLLLDIKALNPTFIIMWLGMNDFLGYAIRGAGNSNHGEESSWYKGTKLTSSDKFQQELEQTVAQLMNSCDCKIVIGNLPDVGSLPLFYWRPYNQLFLDGMRLTEARSKYTDFNEAVAAFNRAASEENKRPFIDFYDNAGGLHPQPMVVIDNTLSDATYPDGKPLEKYRQLLNNEMVLLEVSDGMLNKGFGSKIPLTEDLYLSGQEILEIGHRVALYNTAISGILRNYPDNVVLADVAAEVNKIAGISKADAWGVPFNNTILFFDGVPLDGTLGINSIFSIDGVHFNQRGNAFVANVFIKALNTGFNSRIPTININRYPGNSYTASF